MDEVNNTPSLPTEIWDLAHVLVQIFSMEEVQDFNSDYYKFQEYIGGERQ